MVGRIIWNSLSDWTYREQGLGQGVFSLPKPPSLLSGFRVCVAWCSNFFFFGLKACGILVPQTGDPTGTLCSGSLNHWTTTKEVPRCSILEMMKYGFGVQGN